MTRASARLLVAALLAACSSDPEAAPPDSGDTTTGTFPSGDIELSCAPGPVHPWLDEVLAE